jgi:hypothetical protein
MGHQLNQKTFFQNGEMTAVFLRGKNARSSDPGMMLFQKTCEGSEKATKEGWMRVNQNSSRELDLYLKIDLTLLSSNSAKTAEL